MDPWLVLAGELSLDRTSPQGLSARFAAMRDLAPDPRTLLALEAPTTVLSAVGLSAHGARLLIAAAEAIVELFGGNVPEQDLELRMIPGVGDSVAKAVLCFGHGRSVVPLHTAVSRVATRMAGAEHRRRWQLRLDLHRLARPVGPDASFNAAVLELGATVCHAVDPRCDICPVREHCASADAAGNPDLLVLEAVA
jgi:A/G-specific adenine glycosylase